ncbi:MAG TPA: hypothetical protein VNM14_04175 [Planctomycetota bacterium]|jgi:hypothetical protein|nr:hypothetical protein [Planctomycetota bacterium]
MQLAAIALLSLLTQEKVIFEEKFAGKLADGWTWLREDAAGWKLEGGSLKIKAQPGKIWYKTKTAKNVLLRKLPEKGTADAALSMEVTVDANPEANSEQCGLYLHFDDGNFVKIIREHLKGKTNVMMVRELKNIPEPQQPKEEAATPVRLKLVWSGAKVSGAYKTTGEWIPVGEVDCPVPDGSASVALASHGGAPESERWATFRDLRVVKLSK